MATHNITTPVLRASAEDIERGFSAFESVVHNIKVIQDDLPAAAEEFNFSDSIAEAVSKFEALDAGARQGFIAAVAVFHTISLSGEPSLPLSRRAAFAMQGGER